MTYYASATKDKENFMTDISITIDETANGETVYCKELDAFLQIYIIQQSTISSDKQAAQDKVDQALKAITALNIVLAKRDEALNVPIQPLEPPIIP